MATFYANPNDEKELWIEKAAIDGYGFRIWHVMFFCFAGFIIIMILICCCIKIRVPRTKQQIEADYRRKKLADKFRERLRLIQNQDMDTLDLQKALEIIQEDYKIENKNLQFEIAPSCPPADYNVPQSNDDYRFMQAEPQQPSSLANKLVNVMRIAKFSAPQSLSK